MRAREPKTPLGVTLQYFVKWTVIALAIGLVGGLVGGLFFRAIAAATALREAHGWLLYLLPFAGLLIVFLYRVTHEEKNRGTNAVLQAVSADEEVTVATGPLIFVSTVLTHLTGGSAGREGAALQLGGSIGTILGKRFGLDEKDRKIAVMCGMSSVFAALFGTPVAAAVFSLEVITVGELYYAALLPCLFAAFAGSFLSGLCGAVPEQYEIADLPAFVPETALWVALLGALTALLAIVFCVAIRGAERLYHRWLPNPYVRIVTAAVFVIALTLVCGTRVYNGSSVALIEQSMEGEARYEAFALKLLFTAATLGGGFKGGEIVPTLVVGSTFGAVFGEVSGFAPSLCAACGMIALFAGVTNCPLTSLLLAMELFGGEGLPFFAVAVALSFALSGYFSLYAGQKFAYSKTRNELYRKR